MEVMRLMTRRDVTVGGIAAALAFSLTAAVRPQAMVQHPIAIDWNSITATKTAVGETRQFGVVPTATLDELELHVTTLNADRPLMLRTSIPMRSPRHHPRGEGTVEVLVQGDRKRAGPGSVIFNASRTSCMASNGLGPRDSITS